MMDGSGKPVPEHVANIGIIVYIVVSFGSVTTLASPKRKD